MMCYCENKKDYTYLEQMTNESYIEDHINTERAYTIFNI